MTEISRLQATASERPARLTLVWRAFRKAPGTAKLGLLIILAYALVALFAPWIAPYGESQVFPAAFGPWDARHLFGTDQLGRDVLTRLIYGARNTIGIALAATILSFLIGALLGMLAALRPGIIDQLLSRIVDVLMSIPGLIFSLMLLAIYGSTVWSLIFIIAALDSTRMFRLARATSLGVVVMDYVEVARLRAENSLWIVWREILPNILPTLVAEVGLRFCFVFLSISALSFLGVGIQPPTADWGTMVRENAILLTYGDVTPLLPALAIGILTIAVNFFFDWLLQRSSGIKE